MGNTTSIDRQCDAQDVALHVLPPQAWNSLLGLEAVLRERRTAARELELMTDDGLGRVAVAKVLRDAHDVLASVRSIMRNTHHQDVVEHCPFVGEVDAQLLGERLVWHCPACGTEHDEYVDPDAQLD